MAGNKHDNGVHEIGTPETLKAYQEDTPGQEVEKYLAGIQEVIQEKKEKQKKTFMQVFQNPLKGFPYNEELEDNLVKPIKEGYGKIKDNHYDVKISVKKNDVKNVVKGINKLTSGNQYEYEDIDMDGVYPYGKSDGDIYIQGDDAGSLGLAIQKMFRNKVQVMGESVEIKEGRLSDLLIDIQQGATAKELARDWDISLSQAKSFLKDYYGQKKGNRKEEVEVDEAFSKKQKSGKEIARKMLKIKSMKGFSKKVSQMKSVSAAELDKILPDYVSGGDIGALFEGKNLMPAIQKIVDTKGAAKVGGVMLDMFTASVITQAYAKVNDANKKKMENSNIQTLVRLAQRLMGMKEEVELGESIRDVENEFPRDREWKKIVKKHANAIKKFWRSGQLDGKAEEDIVGWAMSNGEIRTDDVDETDEWLHDVILANEEVISEGTNGMNGKKINVRYRPARAVRGEPFRKKLTSHSTIEKSDLFRDIERDTWELKDDCNSIAIRVPSARGSEKDKMKWRELVNSATNPAGLIRGGGLATSEVEELFQDMRKAAKEFKGQVLAQSHEISISNKKGPLNMQKGLTAMLKAIDEFGMRNHVSVSGRDGVLTQIQDAANYLNEETLQEAQTYKSIIQGLEKDKKEISKKSKSFGQNDTKFVDKAIDFLKMLEKEGIPAGQISQVDFVTNRVPKFFVGNPQKSPSFSKFTPNDVKKAVKHAKKMGIMESVEDVIEGKMDGQKLTGQEISVYFRRNKVRDKMTRKAVEIALDHGGAMNYAIKQIEKLKRGLSKNKDVQKALNYANFGEQVRIKEVGFMFKEDSPVAGNLQVEGDPYIPFKTGSGKLNKNIERYWKKEIKGISKDELLKIQTMYMITDHPGVVSMYKAGKRDFLKSLKD